MKRYDGGRWHAKDSYLQENSKTSESLLSTFQVSEHKGSVRTREK